MSCFTFPVDAVPSYDDILTNEISHGTLIIRMRSAANTNDPLSMASSNGFLSAMSLLIRSATTFTFLRISASGIDTLKVLSFIFITLIGYNIYN